MMQAGKVVRAGTISLCFLVLNGCGEHTGEKGFQSQYVVARDALERGLYVRASEAYADLIPRSGPLEPRLRLEYAHTLLRAGRFDAAAQEADILARSQTDTARSAALAVLGTAAHEQGVAALAAGDTAAGRQHLLTAKSALSEMLANDPQLDPMGAMAGRQAEIAARLKTL